MSLELTSEQREFAQEVRDFIAANLDPAVRAKILSGQMPSRPEREAWQKCLAARGWGAPAWPVEFGGTGWSVIERHIFDEVLTEEAAPGFPVFGMSMLAPVLMRFGTDEQKREILPGILTMDDFWCQGFSEPGAGSDLASLTAQARLEDGHWVINGQKIWTTLAHEADKIFVLLRTSNAPKKQLGLSILLVDMKTPGVVVRPIITIDNHHEVNEVFFTDVRVPASAIIGEEGMGWTYAKYLLGHERTSIARIGQSRRELKRLKAAAVATAWRGGTVAQTGWFRRRHAEIEIRHQILESTTLRFLRKIAEGGKAGAEANLLKVHGSEIQQDLAELWMDVVGEYSFAYGQMQVPPTAHFAEVIPWQAVYVAGAYFNSRKLSIYGGSNEIQRNIIAKTALAL